MFYILMTIICIYYTYEHYTRSNSWYIVWFMGAITYMLSTIIYLRTKD